MPMLYYSAWCYRIAKDDYCFRSYLCWWGKHEIHIVDIFHGRHRNFSKIHNHLRRFTIKPLFYFTANLLFILLSSFHLPVPAICAHPHHIHTSSLDELERAHRHNYVFHDRWFRHNTVTLWYDASSSFRSLLLKYAFTANGRRYDTNIASCLS